MAMEAVIMLGGARLLDMAIPHSRFTIMLISSCFCEYVVEYRSLRFVTHFNSFKRSALCRTQSWNPCVVNSEQDFRKVEMLYRSDCRNVSRLLSYHLWWLTMAIR